MALLSLIPTSPGDGASSDDALEGELVRRIAAGERDALARLYHRYQRRLGRFLARVTRRADVIEEAFNETFWVVWQKAGQFRGDSKVSTWVMGIAYRCALKTLREHGDPLADSTDGEPHLHPHSHPHSHPYFHSHPHEDPGADAERSDWLSKGLARLTPDQRLTLELAYGAGHSLDEIATIMACQVSTVKARMFHARVRLRHLLPILAGTRPAPEGGTDQDDPPHEPA